jgi:uncharacterized membrane protein
MEEIKSTKNAKTKQMRAEENKAQSNESIGSAKNQDKSYCPPETELLPLKSIVQIVYVCEALSYFFGITAVVGLIINYLRFDEARGTWLESHFVWQVRTFWISLVVAVIGCFFIFIGIGFLILAVNLVWIIYRIVKGWILLREGSSIKNHLAFL